MTLFWTFLAVVGICLLGKIAHGAMVKWGGW